MTEAKAPKAPKPSAPCVAPTFTTAVATDAHHGQGGMYTLVNGQRVLVHRTGQAAVDMPTDTTAAAPSTPAADAAQPTTLE